MTKIDYNDSDQGKVQLRDGSFAVHIVVPSGIFSGTSMVNLAELSEKYGNKEIRLDMEQSLYILGVKNTKALLQEKFFEKYKSVDSPYFNHLIACAGTKHCPFGVIENKNDAINMSKYLDERVPLESGRVRMYWSACVKGCGIHGLGDIGFEGCKTKVNGETENGVNISIGGKLVSEEGEEGRTIIKSAPLRYAQYYIESIMLEYKKQKLPSESFESFNNRILSQYSSACIGFIMKLDAYVRYKNIDVNIGFFDKTKTSKNEEFEVFELGRKLYYKLSNKEPYSSYERYTNVLKSEKLEDIHALVPNCDDNIASMLESILNSDEKKRAVVFSEITSLIEIY